MLQQLLKRDLPNTKRLQLKQKTASKRKLSLPELATTEKLDHTLSKHRPLSRFHRTNS